MCECSGIRVRMQNWIHRVITGAGCALALVVAACFPYSPPGADKADAGDAGTVPEKPQCTDRVSACRHKCNQADLGLICRSCCEDTGKACDKGDDYSFNACLDLQ